ncbi:energy-coupling factor ABC transporter ATP-binding protein [Fusibacter paucivorans]|uniref:Energy-coupling factor ABC transporter ATP-binding protein n=1 Tax=Fusibacter paucivorans TaxID=76009 RepID=A0ABS5PKP8_9FIRM|nr:energy-coupling factor ABC transporter ATP-binding protein [Fusibacter paucivorans]MBS7525462.1 energy-coupling factor ABC transporter ATP-binding protein [Fusibacter paucivorans]
MPRILIKTESLNFNHMIRYPDLQIQAEKLTFIKGPSGTGKTTLLKLLNATTSPASGTICLNDESIDSIDAVLLRQQLLLCGQTVYLFDSTIRENFAHYYRYRNLAIPDDDTIQKYLTLCLAPFPLDTHCQTLSGGERQRIYIAIFLSFQSDVLMLDEPTSALDETTSRKLFENLKLLMTDTNRTLIVVSHDQRLIETYADAVIDLDAIKEQTQRSVVNTALTQKEA